VLERETMKTKTLIREMLREDVSKGDVTSRILINPAASATGVIVAKQSGVLAGLEEAKMVFRELGLKVKPLKSDGEKIKPGTAVMLVRGRARNILAGERVALNLLMRMSGIATATAELRKTAPLSARFDKQAVIVGGGSPHRRNLSEQILIKDNHLRVVGSIEEAVRKAKSAHRGKVEVEACTVSEALSAARAGADIIMLDNMRPKEIQKTVRLLKREGLRDRVVLEASGGINPSNIADYAATGVDIISTSYMTMKAPAIDMSLELTEIH